MDNITRIPLQDGSVAIVDNADADLIKGFVWRRTSNGYVYADRGSLRISLHRLIAGAGENDLRVDHENGDPLDNRAINLRICTPSQNGANRGPDRRRAGRTSRFKGVSWSRTKNRWVTYIHVNGKTRYGGSFKIEEDAAREYDRMAFEAWGEFARLNNV